MYAANAFLINGDWNKMDYICIIKDTGREPKIFKRIDKSHMNFGKKITRIILTYSQHDHAELLFNPKKLYNLKVFAFLQNVETIYFGHGPPLNHV